MPSFATFSIPYHMLYMVWPATQTPPPFQLPEGYRLRYYRDEDAAAYCQLVNQDHWRDSGWRCTERSLADMIVRTLPRGFFVVEHETSGALVATATARHRPDADMHYFPWGGEICLVYVHADHRRLGLGRAMTIAALQRLTEVGYANIYLNVMDERLPALNLYFTLGFTPLLYTPEVTGRWQEICGELKRPFTPEGWPTRTV